ANEIEDEHPTTAKAKFALPAEVLVDGEEHPRTEQHERASDDLFEDRIHPRRKDGPEQESGDAEDENDERMAEGVERRQSDRVTLLVSEPRLPERVHRPGPPRGMLVLVATQLGGLMSVRWHRRSGRYVRL